jgi:hypothetical protein
MEAAAIMAGDELHAACGVDPAPWVLPPPAAAPARCHAHDTIHGRPQRRQVTSEISKNPTEPWNLPFV